MDATWHDPPSARGWHRLVPFPAAGDVLAVQVAARARLAGHHLEVEFRIDGPIAELLLPEPGGRPERRDGLWRSTCFEVFVGGLGRSSYIEFNLAPNGDWATWAFTSYRAAPSPVGDGTQNLFRVQREATSYRLAATLALPQAAFPPGVDAPDSASMPVAAAQTVTSRSAPDAAVPPAGPGPWAELLPRPDSSRSNRTAPATEPSPEERRTEAPAVLELNLTTVLETGRGTIVHLALAHTRRQPDFHAPEARVLRLAAGAAALGDDRERESSRRPCNPGPSSGEFRP